MVAYHCKEADPVHKVTIIPRGQALGLTHMLPVEDQYTKDQQKYLDEICMALGGRVAEEIFLGKIGSGAYGDIRMVTGSARAMVTRLGMSDKLGPISFEEGSEQVFLGRDYARHTSHSEKTLQEIDAEINRIVDEQLTRARAILEQNRDQVETVTAALLERETIDGDEFKILMAGDELPLPKIDLDYSLDDEQPAPAEDIPAPEETLDPDTDLDTDPDPDRT